MKALEESMEVAMRLDEKFQEIIRREKESAWQNMILA
jgi:hypothetical protein